MKRFLIKILFLAVVVYGAVISVNYFTDPASLYHSNVVDTMTSKLLEGNIIERPGDVDEGLFQESMISSMPEIADTVIVGSSHIMYQPWEFDDYYIAGLSGAYLGDYYALIGMIEYYHHILPEKIVIGVDPWAFMTGVNNGRHTSAAGYASYELSLVNEAELSTKDIGRLKSDFDKIRELVSFSYFQSSFRALRSNGISLYSNRENIIVSDNDDIGEVNKILPNGRRVMTYSGIHSKEENDASAQSAINQNAIYQLGAGFSELQTENLDDFELLIQHLLSNGVEVEFYFHPWYPSVYDYFEATEQYSGIIKLEEYVRDMAGIYEIDVHGSYNPYVLGMSEEDFADWLHLNAEEMLESYNIIVL